jgi:hypothetical protein
LLEHGADVRIIQQLLGNSKLGTTQVYTEVSIKLLQETHARTHPASNAVEKPATDLYNLPMTNIFDAIVRDLREMPAPKLVEVSRYIHSLHPITGSANRQRAAILATAGCMAGQEGEDFECAVRETADRIDAHE